MRVCACVRALRDGVSVGGHTVVHDTTTLGYSHTRPSLHALTRTTALPSLLYLGREATGLSRQHVALPHGHNDEQTTHWWDRSEGRGLSGTEALHRSKN